MQSEKKSSKVISDELQNVHLENGPPRVVQSDQGGEFKGAVERVRPYEHKFYTVDPSIHSPKGGLREARGHLDQI